MQDAQTTSSGESLVLSERGDGVAIMTLNRAKARNALSLEMIAAVTAEVEALSSADDIKAVVLAASGPAFCAGHDLKQLTAHRVDDDGGRAFYGETMQACAEMMQAIVNSPKPFIAAVHGMATAAGCQLVATCDLAVAGRAAKFCTPGVNIGLFCSTPMVALSRNVPRKRAMEMLLLGELVDAEDAQAYGLVNKVVDDGDVLAAAQAYADRIASKSSVTLAIGKQAFYQQIEMDLAGAYDYAADVMTTNMMERDAEEGIEAFIEKREPHWGKGR